MLKGPCVQKRSIVWSKAVWVWYIKQVYVQRFGARGLPAFSRPLRPLLVFMEVCAGPGLYVALFIGDCMHEHDVLVTDHWANSIKTWHKASLGNGDSSLFKWRATPFSKGNKLRNSENILTKFKNLLHNHWANLNQTWHKASLGNGTQFCSNEGKDPLLRGVYYQIPKIHWRNLKIFCRTTEPIPTKLRTEPSLYLRTVQFTKRI